MDLYLAKSVTLIFGTRKGESFSMLCFYHRGQAKNMLKTYCSSSSEPDMLHTVEGGRMYEGARYLQRSNVMRREAASAYTQSQMVREELICTSVCDCEEISPVTSY